MTKKPHDGDGDTFRTLICYFIFFSFLKKVHHTTLQRWDAGLPEYFRPESKGLYTQSDGSLATVNIDASKGVVYLWVHLSFANFAIFELKRHLKLLEMACDQIQTCLIFPLRWAYVPIKIGRNAQWVHLFFDGFR